ncbi:MAG: DUF2804 domain-containing protein, partial [Oscillospiraceae bacterium]|nr:DUF2804 domain-containing protein [Oscillospiraceae bacterium]
MRNHEITEKQLLLNEEGNLREPGWSRAMVQRYRRADIKAPAWRIKEWDYYLVMGSDFALCLTLNDMGYLGMISVSLVDFSVPREHTETILTPFPMGKFRMPEQTEAGKASFCNDRVKICFSVKDGIRRLKCRLKNFEDGNDLECDVTLTQPEGDSIVIATPWEKAHHFYYNHKISGMPASGYVTVGDVRREFDPAQDLGLLDWGRGVWTYKNTWYWGSGSGYVDGKRVGFNIGYGFGDTSAASENVIFVDGKAHKLDDVTFHIPEGDYCAPWKFTSSDGRFEMDFVPIIDR